MNADWRDAMKERGWDLGGGDRPPRLHLIYFNEIEVKLDHRDFVEGLLCTGAMSLLYGPSSCGKTHEACDLGLHVAMGWRWRGRDVERGGVIYICGEGGHGISNRIAAFRQYYGIEDQDVPFAIVPTTVNLLDSQADVDELIALVKQAAARMTVPVVLVIVDTLSRAMVGGDENAPDDMGALVANGDRIREATKAHLMFVHHTGKDAAKGARGHSILRAATDSEIEITKDDATGIATATVTKQRDLPTEGQWSFRLEQVELGTNQRGKPVTACVALPAEDAPKPAKKIKLGGAAQIALRALHEAMADMGLPAPASTHIPSGRRVVMSGAWRTVAYARNISEGNQDAKSKAFKRAWEELQAKGLIGSWQDWIWLAESGQ
jgi:hypothetical protein